jgi:uncharacterized protein (TIGR02147 family)
MQAIFEYDNYRHFLRDNMAWNRTFNKKFSLRYLALKAGFNSHSFLDNVIKGARNLTLESAEKVAKALRLGRRESLFFKALVAYNQAKTSPEREEALREMRKIRKTVQFYRLQESQYAYYSQWYLPVLRELAVYSDWNGDYRRLAKLVKPAIAQEQAEEGIKTLIEIGMLRRNADGALVQTEQLVSAEEVPGYIFREARTQYILRAIEAAETLPATERHVSWAVMAMSRKTFLEITRLLDEERKKALVMASEDDDVDGVYALNIQVFPLAAALTGPRTPPRGKQGKP